jgi:hypothetical protein
MEDNPLSPSDDPARLSDLLNLPEALQRVVRSLRQRPPFTLAELAALVEDASLAESMLADLQARGLAVSLPPENSGAEPRYRLRLQGRRQSPLEPSIWQQLEEPDHE